MNPPIDITGFTQQDGMRNDRSRIKIVQVAQGRRSNGVGRESRQGVTCTSDHGGIQSSVNTSMKSPRNHPDADTEDHIVERGHQTGCSQSCVVFLGDDRGRS